MCRITTGWRPRFLSNVIPKLMPWVFSRDPIYSIKIHVCGKEYWTKIASAGHVMMQVKRLRALMVPLQLGLALQMHHLEFDIDIFSVEIHWKLYLTKYESFCVDLSVLTTTYFRLPRDKTDLHLVKLNCIAKHVNKELYGCPTKWTWHLRGSCCKKQHSH